MVDRVTVVDNVTAFYNTHIVSYFPDKKFTAHSGRPLGESEQGKIYTDIMSGSVSGSEVFYEVETVIYLPAAVEQREALNFIDYIHGKYRLYYSEGFKGYQVSLLSTEKYDSVDTIPIIIIITASIERQLTQEDFLK